MEMLHELCDQRKRARLNGAYFSQLRFGCSDVCVALRGIGGLQLKFHDTPVRHSAASIELGTTWKYQKLIPCFDW